MTITGASEQIPGEFWDNGGQFVHVKHPDYGAKGDLKTVTDGAITTATAVLTSATAAFTSADAGKTISVVGAIATAGSGTVTLVAGAATFSGSQAGKIVNGSIVVVAGTSYTVSAFASTTTCTFSGAPTFGASAFTIASPLQTTILSYTNATTVTLAASATRTVTGATVKYGTDDSTAIAAALTFAAGLKPIFFGSGSYYAANVTVTANNVLLAQPGTATLVLKPLATTVGSPILNVTGSNVTIAGLGFDGNKAGQLIDGFADAYDTGPNSTGRAYRCAVKFKDDGTLMSGLTVDRCTFTSTYGSGVATNNTSKIRVLHCTFDACNFEGAYIYSDFVGASYTKDHQVIGNRVTNGGTGDATTNSSAYVFSSAENFVFANNVAESVERAGIKMEYPRRGVVSGNSFTTNSVLTFGGIEMQSSIDSMVITGNKIYNWSHGILLNPQSAQLATNVTITGNVIETTTASGTGDGISMGNGAFEGLTITGNTMLDIHRYCVVLVPVAASKNLIISGNNCTPQATGLGGGFFLKASGGNWTNVRVVGNILDHGAVNPNAALIEFGHAAAETFGGVAVIGNIVTTLNGTIAMRETAAVVTSGVFDGNETNGVITLLGTWELGPSNFTTGSSSSFTSPNTLTYSASMTPRATNGITQVITATNNTAFTINAPAAGTHGVGKMVKLMVKNTSGGALGVATFNATYKMVAWVQPATGFHRVIWFEYDGTNYQEVFRSAADVAN